MKMTIVELKNAEEYADKKLCYIIDRIKLADRCIANLTSIDSRKEAFFSEKKKLVDSKEYYEKVIRELDNDFKQFIMENYSF